MDRPSKMFREKGEEDRESRDGLEHEGLSCTNTRKKRSSDVGGDTLRAAEGVGANKIRGLMGKPNALKQS